MTQRFRQVAQSAPAILLGVIVVYGALLRFEAFHQACGPLAGSGRFVAAQGAVAAFAARLRPESVRWPPVDLPYRHDPKSYLDSARAMRHFYEARLREPLFVFSTKVGLWVTGGQDVAVSLVSSVFGWLLVPATYALGRALGGVVVGLTAALLVAIDPQLIGTGVHGYRDDLFSLLTVLFAVACLRLHRRGSLGAGVLVGVVGAGACLTRITAITFVLPGLLAVMLSPAPGRRQGQAIAVLVAVTLVVALVAPFLASCWAVYGDPLYSINWHSAFYARRGHIETPSGPNAMELVWRQLGQNPLVTVDSVVRGFTHHPWVNQGTELGRHWGGLPASVLRLLGLAGLLMWLWFTEGRLAVAVLAGSMVPFAFTWEVYSEGRFTEHVAPFYMAAAAYAAVTPIRWAVARVRGSHDGRVGLCGAATRALASAGLVLAFFVGVALLPPLIVYQQLASGQPASVGGDPRVVIFMPREIFFFAANGWSGPRTEGNFTFHDLEGARGRLRVPMSANYGYRCLVRLAPMSSRQDPGAVELRLNGWSGVTKAEPVPDGVSRHWVTIPARVASTGLNDVELARADGSGGPLRLWYVRFFPEVPDVRTSDGR